MFGSWHTNLSSGLQLLYVTVYSYDISLVIAGYGHMHSAWHVETIDFAASAGKFTSYTPQV